MPPSAAEQSELPLLLLSVQEAGPVGFDRLQIMMQ